MHNTQQCTKAHGKFWPCYSDQHRCYRACEQRVMHNTTHRPMARQQLYTTCYRVATQHGRNLGRSSVPAQQYCSEEHARTLHNTEGALGHGSPGSQEREYSIQVTIPATP